MISTPKQYALAWYELLSSSSHNQWKKITTSVLYHLYKNGRISWLPEITTLMEQYERITITSTSKLDTALTKKIINKLLPDKKVIITEKLDPYILGGVKVETQNQRWNLNLRSQLALLFKKLS
jgi:F0F1-type ATP synthase delta subunit